MKKAMTAAAILSLGTLAQAATQTSAFQGYAVMEATPVEVEGEPWVEFSVSAILSRLDATSDWGMDATVSEFHSLRISYPDALILADALVAWADAPHSDQVFQRSSEDSHVGLGFSGLNLDLEPELTHVVVARISHRYGPGRWGVVAVGLPEAEARALAAQLTGWANYQTSKPYVYSSARNVRER